MKVSQITRRDIVDAISVEKINWSGRMEETEFLSRLYNLASLPSDDFRFKDAAGDIWQHRVNSYDWDDDWVFYDSRFHLMNGDDEAFFRAENAGSSRAATAASRLWRCQESSGGAVNA